MSLSISSFKSFVLAFAVVFVVGAGGFVAGSEVLVRYVVAPTDGYESYKAKIATAHAPIAAFGDSHVANGLVSNDRIVNLGFAGDTLPLMLVKAKVYVASNPAARIILQYSPQQFAIYRAGNMQADAANEILSVSRPWLMFMESHFRGYLLGYWSAALHDPDRVIAAFTGPSLSSGPAADEPVEASKVGGLVSLSPAEQRRAAEIRVQLHAPLPPSRTVESLLAMFSDTVREFKKGGIDMCIVEYPLSNPYRKAMRGAVTFATMKDRMRRFMASEGLRLVDLTASLPDSAFADVDHVSARTKPALTKLVLASCFGSGQGMTAK